MLPFHHWHGREVPCPDSPGQDGAEDNQWWCRSLGGMSLGRGAARPLGAQTVQESHESGEKVFNIPSQCRPSDCLTEGWSFFSFDQLNGINIY